LKDQKDPLDPKDPLDLLDRRDRRAFKDRRVSAGYRACVVSREIQAILD
jgi:hypothetical protein